MNKPAKTNDAATKLEELVSTIKAEHEAHVNDPPHGVEVPCRQCGKVSDVICDDVYNQIGRHGRVQYLLDIWPIFEGARRDPRLRAVRRKLRKRLWAWGIN